LPKKVVTPKSLWPSGKAPTGVGSQRWKSKLPRLELGASCPRDRTAPHLAASVGGVLPLGSVGSVFPASGRRRSLPPDSRTPANPEEGNLIEHGADVPGVSATAQKPGCATLCSVSSSSRPWSRNRGFHSRGSNEVEVLGVRHLVLSMAKAGTSGVCCSYSLSQPKLSGSSRRSRA